MPGTKVDLICFSPPAGEWPMGDVVQASYSVANITELIGLYASTIKADWVFFCDSAQLPDTSFIRSLITQPVDAWHAGIKAGLAGMPSLLNYVEPLWMYNTDAGAEVEHSSFRLSMRCALIRTSVLKAVDKDNVPYSTPDMLGLDIGYVLLKAGAVIRYHPQLLKHHIHSNITSTDEWIFARRYFTGKWQLWTLLNAPGGLLNLGKLMSASGVKYKLVKPVLHSSRVKGTPEHKTVSVLIPTLDRYSYLFSELEQLAKQELLALEVLITDQTEETKRVPVEAGKYPGLNIRYFPQNEKGQCMAWNKLLEEAKGEFVLFLGDDADDIAPDFIKRLLFTQAKFNADIVAARVIENGVHYGAPNEQYYMSDTLPIALVRKALLDDVGYFDMFFNRNIRADQDLSIRCHLKGALMIYDSSTTVFHHRAPVGGLRAHGARAHTTNSVKQSITTFVNPTASELYLAHKYYDEERTISFVRIKYLNQLFIKGGILRKLARFVVFIVKLPSFINAYKKNKALALEALAKANVRR